MLESFKSANPFETALALLAVALATIVGARIFQGLGYPPCDLCLEQRYAYYTGVPLAAVVALAARAGAPASLVKIGLALLALLFAANAVLAVYHTGVEFKWWQGPTACTGSAMDEPENVTDLLAAIDKVKVVRCDEVGLRILGLSLANWDVFISAALAGLAARAALRRA